MEKILFVYVTIFAIALAIVILNATRNDESLSRKWAKVRIPVEERSRRQPSEPQSRDDEYNPQNAVEWLIFGAVIILIFALLSRAGI